MRNRKSSPYVPYNFVFIQWHQIELKERNICYFYSCSLGFPPNSFRVSSISFTLIFFGEKWWIDSDFLRLVHLMWSHNVFIIIYKNYVLLRHRKYFSLPREEMVKYHSLNEGHLLILLLTENNFTKMHNMVWN